MGTRKTSASLPLDLESLSPERMKSATFAQLELLAGQIRRFLILHKELDPDDEEITRTRKIRRGYIATKYAALIEALYGEGDHIQVEARVTYEDGRTGTVRADLLIRRVEMAEAGAR